jgi:hypothetical protein
LEQGDFQAGSRDIWKDRALKEIFNIAFSWMKEALEEETAA